ncbi:MAG TPA: hypothetical protein VFI75_05245, partial [Candidatus Acidoferrum sp.]|nr:hypothetical protein [Candidatus Acidoferrum sp.]
MNNTDCIPKSETRRAESHATGPSGSGTVPRRFWEWGIILIVAAVYLTHLAPGHNFRDDDFGAYVMHAANLAEGRPYTAIHYIPNPETLWLAPPEGYPPVYPFLLAPVYQVWGLNLRALKVVTVLCFAGFLLVFSEFLRPYLSPLLSSCALLVVGFNPAFWGQRDALLAESPYLLFSFAALLAIQKAYKDLAANQWRIGFATLVGTLLYLAYGTRTIGIVLLPAMALADVIKFKKPSRFLVGTLGAAIVLIVAQNVMLFSPAGYSGALQHSVRMGLDNALFYGKTLSYAWQNGFSKKIQIVFALLFTALAAMSFVRSLWTRQSAKEFYLLGYVAMLLLLRAQIGMRGLLPVLPLYFALGLEGFGWIVNRYGQMARIVSVSLLMLFVGVSYGTKIRRESKQPPEPNIQDATAQELISFLRANTLPSEVLIFPKPRVLALMTNRTVAMLAPAETPEDSALFMKSINAGIVIK